MSDKRMSKIGAGLLASLLVAPLAPGARAEEDYQAQLHEGVERLQFLKGHWRACVAKVGADGRTAAGEIRMVDFRSVMNGLYLETETRNASSLYRMVFSYDVAQQRYRLASYDDRSGLLDIYEGRFNEAGVLVMANLDSGTHYTYQGVDYFNRMSFAPAPAGWSSAVDVTGDGGDTWRRQLQITATPAKGDETGAAC